MGRTAANESSSSAALALDFDGVIVDSMPEQERAWREAARRTALGRENERVLIENLYAGKARERMFDDLDLPEATRRALRLVKDTAWHACRLDVALMSGAQEVLPRLSRLMPLGIATTAEREYVEVVLEREGLLGCIGHVVTDMDVANPKPAPDMLKELASRFGVGTGALCMVGDSQSDEAMSRAAGCRFIRFGRAAKWGASAQKESAEDWGALGRFFGA